jgi:hypothetical protein
MSTRLEAFCNITTDLQGIEPSIDSFDRKRLVQNFVSHTTNVYVAHDSGYVDLAYVDGKEQSMQSSVSDVDGADKAFYDSSADALYIYNSLDPNNLTVEGAEDWATVKQRVVNEQADRIRSYINRPIFERNKSEDQGAASRTYDFVLINANAALAVAELMRPIDFQRAQDIEERYISPDSDGMLDRLKRGDYALWHEATYEKNEGRVVPVSLNTNTTGYIADTKVYGLPAVDFDDVRVKISNGGTFTSGSANTTVKYSVFTKNDDGLATNQVITDEEINGSYQALAYNIYIRFSEGVYTTNDEWQIIVQGEPEEHGTVKSEQISRR